MHIADITPDECLAKHGLPEAVLLSWAQDGCLTLGRCVYSEMRGGVRFFSSADIEQALQYSRKVTLRFPGWPIETKMLDFQGRIWRILPWARRLLGFTHNAFIPWIRHGCSWLYSEKGIGKRKFTAKQVPVYVNRQHYKVWVCLEDDAKEVERNKKEKKVPSVARGSCSGMRQGNLANAWPPCDAGLASARRGGGDLGARTWAERFLIHGLKATCGTMVASRLTRLFRRRTSAGSRE
jgi:hypothetical protein